MSKTQPNQSPTTDREKLPYILVMGWLVKSPPENKMKRSCKLLRSRWRKRFFVLRQSNHTSYNYEMIYFKDRDSRNILGTIDLKKCQQVTEAVTSNCFRNLLAVSTVHKKENRTYYLAAPSLSEMKEWVHWLCLASGLNMTPMWTPSLQLVTTPGNLSNVDRQFLLENPSELQESCARVFTRDNSATDGGYTSDNAMGKRQELDTNLSLNI